MAGALVAGAGSGAGAGAGAGLLSGGGSEALMSKQAASFLPNNPAAADKLGSFASEKGMSLEQFSKALKTVFGDRPGNPEGPEHHKDPVQSVINEVERMIKFAERVSMLSKLLKPSPSPSPGMSNDKDKEEENNSASMAPKQNFSMRMKP